MDSIEKEMVLKLDKMGIEYVSLKSNIKAHLYKLELTLAEVKNKRVNLINEYKKVKPSVLSISTDAKIARQTLYNNKILKEYIEFSIRDFDSYDPFQEIDELKNKINLLNEQLDKMYQRDIEVEIMFNENKELKKKLKDIKRNLEVQSSERREAEKRLRELKKKNRLLEDSISSDNKIIDLRLR